MDPAREPITPAQTTFLKLLDAYLHTSSEVNDSSSFSFLAPTLRDLLLYVQLSLRASLAATVKDDRSFVDRPTASSTEAPPATDARLPKVCEALVLVAQSSSTLLLREYDASTTRLRSQLLTGTGATLELLIDVLRLLDAFLPRVGLHAPSNADFAGFAYVKRDLVRVLGTLAHDDREVQDRVRGCGGIEVVLNLCVEDARNPYLREHAIFALRHLLKDNIANQKVVDELKLTGVEDKEGVLRDVRRGPRI